MAEPINPTPAVSVFKIKKTPKEGLYELFVSVDKSFDKHIKEAMQALAPRLADQVRKTFDLKGARGDREGWLITRNPTPLIDKGDLYRSIRGEVEGKGSQFVISVGTDKEYAKVLNEGCIVKTDVIFDKWRSKGSYWIHTGHVREMEIPKREFLFMTPNDAEMADETIETAVDVMAHLEGLKKL